MSNIPNINFEELIEVDLNIYSINTVKKAAYKAAAIADIEIKRSGEVAFLYITSLSKQHSASEIKSIINREILDQDLREIIKKETETVRTLILANAFSKTSLIDS